MQYLLLLLKINLKHAPILGEDVLAIFFFFFNWNLLQTNMHFTYRISLVSQLAFSYLMLINKINKLFIVVFLVRLYMFCIIVTNFSVITFLCDQKFKAYLCYHLVQSFIIFVYFC